MCTSFIIIIWGLCMCSVHYNGTEDGERKKIIITRAPFILHNSRLDSVYFE